MSGRCRRAGHAGNAFVLAEQFLHCDPCAVRGERRDFDHLACLDGLMNSVSPLASFSDSSGIFIDNADLAVLNDVVLVQF